MIFPATEHSNSAMGKIPSYFWTTRVIHQLPMNFKYRTAVANEVFGWNHLKICGNEQWHRPYLQEVDNGDGLKGYDCCKDVNGNYCHCKICGVKIGFNHICHEL